MSRFRFFHIGQEEFYGYVGLRGKAPYTLSAWGNTPSCSMTCMSVSAPFNRSDQFELFILLSSALQSREGVHSLHNPTGY